MFRVSLALTFLLNKHKDQAAKKDGAATDAFMKEVSQVIEASNTFIRTIVNERLARKFRAFLYCVFLCFVRVGRLLRST
jgi:hypothetical protein